MRNPQDQEIEWIRRLEDRINYNQEPEIGKGKGLENIFVYPNLNIAGIESGFGGEGLKTIIPAEAKINLGVRLVANQTSDGVLSKIEKHVEQNTPEDVKTEIKKKASFEPYATNRESDYISPVISALEESHEKTIITKPFSSTTLPYNILHEAVGSDCFKIPYANSDENNHSPEENLKVDCFYRGIETSIQLIKKINEEI